MRLPAGITLDRVSRVGLPDRFNVAVPFIDRHGSQGWGAKAATAGLRNGLASRTVVLAQGRVVRAAPSIIGPCATKTRAN